MLGVYISPNGDETTQSRMMLDESTKLARKFGPAPLNQYAAWTALTCIANSKLRYPLPATTLSEKKTCKTIIWPILNVLLPKCHLARRFPQKLLYGPGCCLGLDLPSLFIQQGIFHAVDIVERVHYHDVTGHLIRTAIEHLHLETGQQQFTLSNQFEVINNTLLTKSWVVETWRFMHQYNITIDINLPMFSKRRHHDAILMHTLINSTIPSTLWKKFNKCRLYLNVISLADICTGDGTHISKNAFQGIFDLGTSRNATNWPPRQRPPSNHWTIWKECLIKLEPTDVCPRD